MYLKLSILLIIQKKNSQSKVCRDHFANIQITKNMDITLQKMIEKNDIFK